MTLSPDASEKTDKLKELLDFNTMKSDKQMRDTEAFLASRYYEPTEKKEHTMNMKTRFNTEKRPYKAKTKLDIDKDFLMEGEGGIPDTVKKPME